MFLLLNYYGKYLDKLKLKLKTQIYLKKSPLSDLPKENVNWQYKILKPAFYGRSALPLDYIYLLQIYFLLWVIMRRVLVHVRKWYALWI